MQSNLSIVFQIKYFWKGAFTNIDIAIDIDIDNDIDIDIDIEMIPNWGFSHLRIGDNCSPLPFFLHYLSVLPQNAQVQVLDGDFITVLVILYFVNFNS